MNDIENINMKGSGGSKMPHSHSTPAGVDGGSRTPPATPRKAGKMLAVRVQMLDDTITMFQVQAKALSRVLFDQVCKQLHLLEADYFGLEYQEPNGTKYWLDLEKPVCRQVGLSLIDPLLKFCVKFYTPDPAQLEEEFTRYLFCLQIKRDLAQGLLQCNDNTAALMASYIVQAECGDYVIEDYPDHTYLSTYKFVPHQNEELERRIMENHKRHAGQSPAEADLNLLETARRCELYGMKMHPAKDHENVPLNLAVAHMGIVVFQNFTKINTFSWAKIRKISFKRKRFLIKLHPEGYGYYKDTVEFFFEGRNECKNFWKKCVENHGFFRCSVVKRVVRQKTRVLSRGSSFRYSGKTQKQIVEFVRDNYVKRQTFQRSNSFRQTSGGRALQGLEGGGYRGTTPSSSLMGSSSISAHPLLPLADPALATPALSLSCGSMTLDSPTTATSVSMGGTIHRRDDTATSFRTLTSIDVHSPATPSQVPVPRQTFVASQQRISSTGRISPSNSSPPEFPPPQPRPIPRHPWQRSASCRELYASSFEDSGKAITKPAKEIATDENILEPYRLPSQGALDNPVTRYDESNRSYSAASSKLPSLDHDSVPERVYSSSYPGTSSLSTESGHEESGPAGDLSHDDLSHDSYELLEREHEFEYPESYSSPRDDEDRDENEPLSDGSDRGIEHEMFQMDSETDSFVKHRSVKSTDKRQFESVLGNPKTVRAKSIDRHSSMNAGNDGEFITIESRIQRTSTQIERKYETRQVNSLEQFQGQSKIVLPHQDSARKDPVVLRVQKQKMSVLNELKNLKPKYKITHVDSEILRDEGIMRPKSRVDDDLSPIESQGRAITDPKSRTIRARSVASLETGSLSRGHGTPSSLKRSNREVETMLEKTFAKLQDRDRRSLDREDRKRVDSVRKFEKIDSRERRSMDRSDSRDRRSGYDVREFRRSVERLDIRERSLERSDSREKYELRGKSVERLDFQGLRNSSEYLNRSPKERTVSHRRNIGSRSGSVDHGQRHTLERFDSANKSPFQTVQPRHRHRGRSVERLDSREKFTFDFDPITIERLKSLERRESYERRNEPGSTVDRRSTDKINSRDRRERKHATRGSETKSFEVLEQETYDWRRGSVDRFDWKETKKSRRRNEKGKSEEKSRDDWRSLEKARKENRSSLESKTDTVLGLPIESEGFKSKTVFTEYEPKVVAGVVLGFDDSVPGHTPVERAKSDPNPGRQRLGSNNKRRVLIHQKSIDLTPADSGDEDPFSDGACARRTDVDIPYTLHKRHVMNGTASDEKSESDSGKTPMKNNPSPRDLAKLPLKITTDLSCFDLSKLSEKSNKPISKNIPSTKPKSILSSPSEKSKAISSPTAKLSPTDAKSIVSGLSPSKKSPSKGSSKSINLSSPVDPNVTIVSVIQKKRSPSESVKSSQNVERSFEAKIKPMNFADAVGMELKMKLERKSRSSETEKDSLRTPDESFEKQDSIEKIPLPEIPSPFKTEEEQPSGIETSTMADISKENERSETSNATFEKPKIPEKPKSLEKPSIPEKTKRILEKIESKFSQAKMAKPKIIDTGFDDFMDPVADLPLDEVPVKPALELDSLKVPEFVPFASRPHGEPLRSKSLSLAEEKAPIDTLLSPEVENKRFVPDVSPKKTKKIRSEGKKDFKKQSKSLEADKPPFKKSGSKESRGNSASKIDKSKLKLGEMPQEIIIIDSTEVAPEVSIVQKGRSKSVTRLSDKTHSREEKEEVRGNRGKSASVDEDLIKVSTSTSVGSRSEKSRPKSLGISKSLGSTERRDSSEKISPKRAATSKGSSKMDGKSSKEMKSPVPAVKKSKNEVKLATAESKEDRSSEKKENRSSDKKVSQDSAAISRKSSHTPVLFARARLGLSEGSGIGNLQRQSATRSPISQRRTKSLDAPVIAVHKLPPANAFSSKDDTMDASENPEEQETSREVLPSAPEFRTRPRSIQIDASPNHRSDSTDHTTVPEIFTDSLSVTETSAQYLESPLTECNEITGSADLIPYETEPIVSDPNGKDSKTLESFKGDERTKFIDQSSIESGTEQDLAGLQISIKSEKIDPFSISKTIEGSVPRGFSKISVESRVPGEIQYGLSGIAENLDKDSPKVTLAEDAKKSLDWDDLPDVTVTTVPRSDSGTTRCPKPVDFYDGHEDMVKSPVQISIEECSDDEGSKEEDRIHGYVEEKVVRGEEDLLEMLEVEGDDDKPLDSADTSEDTLDALDTQIRTRGIDGQSSSPDYGAERTDEKTLVEVELTPEYLEMRKEDEDGTEELPKDEETGERTKESVDDGQRSPDRLSVDKKFRLSSERSRSEETSTWTPDREDPESSSCSIARPLGIGQLQPVSDRREIAMKDTRSIGSFEEENNDAVQPESKPESTWKSFPLESSGSSSTEDGWPPVAQDEYNAVRSQSEESNGQNEDSFQEDLADFPGSFIYPIGPDILTSCGTFALTRTLSRISERSTTSEQDKSDLEDSFKPSSRSPSLDDESLISSDHQPSLSSDPPSGTAFPSISDDRRTSSELPDIPIDVVTGQDEGGISPKSGTPKSNLRAQSSEDWPSPPSSPVFESPVANQVETFYAEIKPEEAVKVIVTDDIDTPGRADRDSDSSDENRTLHDDLHSALIEDGHSSASATTVDGTVRILVKPKSNSHITGSSHSEDTSMGLSMSEWSSSNNTVRQFCQYSGTKSDDNSLAELGPSTSDWSGSTTVVPQEYYEESKSQSDTTTSDKSVTSMRPNSKCKTYDIVSVKQISSSSPLPAQSTSPPLTPPVTTVTSVFTKQVDEEEEDEPEEDAIGSDERSSTTNERTTRAERLDEARRFIETQFEEQRLGSCFRNDETGPGQLSRSPYAVSPPRITLRNEFDETVDEEEIPLPILEEEEEDQDESLSRRGTKGESRKCDKVPSVKYNRMERTRLDAARGDSSEDMHEKYDDWSFEEEREETVAENVNVATSGKASSKFERGFSEPTETGRYRETRSTERPVVVPIRAKSTPHYSTTSLSGESTTSSPPMQTRTQIRTKTMSYSSSRSPQSEGDTSSSMDSPVHTPVRGQIAVRRRRRENMKRRHRVPVDIETKDGGQIVSSTDSSFDVATIPPPLLSERSCFDDEDEQHREYSVAKDEKGNRRRQR